MNTLIACERISWRFPPATTNSFHRWMETGCVLDYNGGSPHFKREPMAVGDEFASLAKMIDDSNGENIFPKAKFTQVIRGALFTN